MNCNACLFDFVYKAALLLSIFNSSRTPFTKPHILCAAAKRELLNYIFTILSIASLVFSALPNAVRRKYPSPLGPKPDPGVPTTLTVSSR